MHKYIYIYIYIYIYRERERDICVRRLGAGDLVALQPGLLLECLFFRLLLMFNGWLVCCVVGVRVSFWAVS